MDGFTGFKTATAEELPDAVAVTDPFHVVRLTGEAWPFPSIGDLGRTPGFRHGGRPSIESLSDR